MSGGGSPIISCFSSKSRKQTKNPHKPKIITKKTKTLRPLKLQGFLMELPVGFEPTTCALRMRCSTPEPRKHMKKLYYKRDCLSTQRYCGIMFDGKEYRQSKDNPR